VAHRSWCGENGNPPSNERLEFLGDAVVGWVVAELAYQGHPDLPEGKLTDVRKGVVSAGALAEVAVELGIGPALLLGKGEDAAAGRTKPSILADAMEAVVAAVYLDAGPLAARALCHRLFAERVRAVVDHLETLDNKTTLQELAARLFEASPTYALTEEGPDHAKRFTATVTVGGRVWGTGEGGSKKQAEQVAAGEAVVALRAANE
jgi:ribonuclease-3